MARPAPGSYWVTTTLPSPSIARLGSGKIRASRACRMSVMPMMSDKSPERCLMRGTLVASAKAASEASWVTSVVSTNLILPRST